MVQQGVVMTVCGNQVAQGLLRPVRRRDSTSRLLRRHRVLGGIKIPGVKTNTLGNFMREQSTTSILTLETSLLGSPDAVASPDDVMSR